ncbi:MAG: peptidoglycan-binding domain-containing protein [Leptolyngbyaceae bacterium]|nr:peptidoglycan-binding domain-containing protein [Leptolyngbyaceae bacterium]
MEFLSSFPSTTIQSKPVNLEIEAENYGSIPVWQRAIDMLEPNSLKQGDIGVEVKKLQQALHLLSVYNGPVDGRFDMMTAASLRILQLVLNIESTGEFDDTTWCALMHQINQIPPT